MDCSLHFVKLIPDYKTETIGSAIKSRSDRYAGQRMGTSSHCAALPVPVSQNDYCSAGFMWKIFFVETGR